MEKPTLKQQQMAFKKDYKRTSMYAYYSHTSGGLKTDSEIFRLKDFGSS